MDTNQPELIDPSYRCPECDTYSGTFTPQPDMEMLHSVCGRVGSINSFIRGTEEYERAYEGDSDDEPDEDVEWDEPYVEESQPEILRNLRRGLADFEIEHPNRFDDDDKVALARVRLLIQAVEDES